MQKFDLEEIPFGELEEFGLSAQKIQDFPEKVLNSLLEGKKTPLIRLSFDTPVGRKYFDSKIRLVRDDFSDNVSVMFSPKPAVKADLSKDFSDAEIHKLGTGEPIFKEKTMTSVEGNGEQKEYNAMVVIQKDQDTGQLIEVPMEPIGRNLKTLALSYDLTASNIQQLKQGHIVIVEHKDNTITSIGINLNTDEGILLVDGDEKAWYQEADQEQEKYSFGTEGCWINDDGTLDYVEEKDYDEKLKAIQRSIGQTYTPDVKEEEEQNEVHDYQENENRENDLEEQELLRHQEEEEDEEQQETKNKVGY